MIIDLELDNDIYKNLESAADERGITVKELLRWIVGEWVRFSQPPRAVFPLHAPPPSPVATETEKLLKLSRLFMQDMIRHGGIKCPNCTMPLSQEDLDAGKCSKCDAEIL